MEEVSLISNVPNASFLELFIQKILSFFSNDVLFSNNNDNNNNNNNNNNRI